MYSLLNFICLALLLLFNPFCFSPKTLTSGYLSIVRNSEMPLAMKSLPTLGAC